MPEQRQIGTPPVTAVRPAVPALAVVAEYMHCALESASNNWRPPSFGAQASLAVVVPWQHGSPNMGQLVISIISRTEAAIMSATYSERELEELKDAFKVYDEDDDGQVASDEAVKVMRAVGICLTEAEAQVCRLRPRLPCTACAPTTSQWESCLC